MRILHIYGSFPNKWQPYEMRFLRNLQSTDFDNCVFTLSSIKDNIPSPVPVYRSRREGIWFVRWGSKFIALLQGLLVHRQFLFQLAHKHGYVRAISEFSLVYEILRLKPNIVHIHHAHLIKQGIFDALLHYSIPWVVSFRGDDLMVKPLMDENWKSKLSWIFEHASAITVVSASLGDRARQLGASEEKIFVIHLPVEVDNPDINSACSENPYKLVSIGRLSWEKGHIYAVDAVALAIKKGCNLEYFILGSGPLEAALRFRAWQLGISERIHILGYVDSGKMSQLLGDCYAVLHPSLTEALSSALVRVQASGIPVVATDVGGIPEVISNEKTGILVEPANPDLLANAIVRLINEPNLWQYFHQNSLERTHKLFSPEIELKAYKKLYEFVWAAK